MLCRYPIRPNFFGRLVSCIALCHCLAPQAPAQGRPDAIWMTSVTNVPPLSAFFGDKSIAFSPEGTLLAWPQRQPDGLGTFFLSRVADGAVLRTVASNSIGTPAFSPDGTKLALIGTNGINIWRLLDGALLQSIPDGTNAGPWLSFSPDGSILAASYLGTYNAHNQIRLWSMAEGSVLRTLSPPPFNSSSVKSAAFSSDGATLAALRAYAHVYITRVADGLQVGSIDPAGAGDATSVAFSPDGSMLASAFGALFFPPEVWWESNRLVLSRASDWSPVTTLTNYEAHHLGYSGVRSLAFSPNGRILLTGGMDGSIRFWRVPDGALIKLYDQPALGETGGSSTNVDTVAFSPDGRHYAYVRANGMLVMANAPVWISDAARTNGNLRLNWQGGTGLYQVQQTSNVASPDWQNLGDATTNTSTNLPLPATTTFFRIQSLTNAP
jgi:WD40 repeat protein